MRHLPILLSLLALLAACSPKHDATGVSEHDSAIDTSAILITQVQKCARLYTTEYHIHKIVTHDDVLRLKGNVLSQKIDIPLPLGERKIAIPMDATLKAYIDFESFSEHNIERHGNRITIVLPDPQVVMTSSRINRKEIREYVGLTRSHFTDKELTVYEQQGRQAILSTIPSLGIIETAKGNAARVLVPMLTNLGYKEEDIIIAFRKDMNWHKLIKMGGE